MAIVIEEKGESKMYESPIIISETVVQTIMEQRENTIVAKVQDAIDVQVDKGELLRALQYDRGQYDKGYADGKADATPKWIPVTERLPENREDVLVVAFWHERWNVQWGWYSPNGRVWHIGLMEETDYPVSHWMHPPEPPEGE